MPNRPPETLQGQINYEQVILKQATTAFGESNNYINC